MSDFDFDSPLDSPEPLTSASPPSGPSDREKFKRVRKLGLLFGVGLIGFALLVVVVVRLFSSPGSSEQSASQPVPSRAPIANSAPVSAPAPAPGGVAVTAPSSPPPVGTVPQRPEVVNVSDTAPASAPAPASGAPSVPLPTVVDEASVQGEFEARGLVQSRSLVARGRSVEPHIVVQLVKGDKSLLVDVVVPLDQWRLMTPATLVDVSYASTPQGFIAVKKISLVSA